MEKCNLQKKIAKNKNLIEIFVKTWKKFCGSSHNRCGKGIALAENFRDCVCAVFRQEGRIVFFENSPTHYSDEFDSWAARTLTSRFDKFDWSDLSTRSNWQFVSEFARLLGIKYRDCSYLQNISSSFRCWRRIRRIKAMIRNPEICSIR
jgi:hypothetical protein